MLPTLTNLLPPNTTCSGHWYISTVQETHKPALSILQKKSRLISDPSFSSERPPGEALWNDTNFYQSINPKRYLVRTSIYKYSSRKTQPEPALLILQNRSRSISDPSLSSERPPGVALWNATNFYQSITPKRYLVRTSIYK